MNTTTKIADFENAIKKNELIIKKKKKSISIFLLLIVFIYTILFNLSGHKLTSLFDNQLHFLKAITYTAIVTAIGYLIYVYLLVLKLSKETKTWNRSLYELSKLDKTKL